MGLNVLGTESRHSLLSVCTTLTVCWLHTIAFNTLSSVFKPLQSMFCVVRLDHFSSPPTSGPRHSPTSDDCFRAFHVAMLHQNTGVFKSIHLDEPLTKNLSYRWTDTINEGEGKNKCGFVLILSVY